MPAPAAPGGAGKLHRRAVALRADAARLGAAQRCLDWGVLQRDESLPPAIPAKT